MDESYDGYEKGKIIGLSSYHDNLLTTQILLDSGAIFSYIPLHALKLKQNNTHPQKDLLYYSNCPDDYITTYTLPLDEATIFIKGRNITIDANYLLTIDWYKTNQQMHLLKDKNGFLYLHPNYRIVWKKNAKELPKYKKLHQTWTY